MTILDKYLLAGAAWLIFTTFDMYMKGHGRRSFLYSLAVFLIVQAIGFAAAVVVLLVVDVHRLLAYVQVALSSSYSLFLGVVVAVALYRVRGTHPIVYGVAEIAVGILAIWFVVGIPKPTLLTADDGGQAVDVSRANSSLVGFLGGIYIIIRGFDNVDKGIAGKLRRFWDMAFPKGTAQTPR